MFLAVWMLCFVLGALAYLEPRSRVLLALLALVAVQTAYADWIDTDRLTQIFARLPIDFVAGILSVAAIDARRRYTIAVPALFALTCVLHATFWTSRAVGLDLWLWYAYGLNLIFVAQLMALALPGGMRLGRELAYRLGLALAWLRGLSGGDLETKNARHEGRTSVTNVWSSGDLLLSRRRA